MAKSQNKYFSSVGRRRSSVAVVKLYSGKGESTVNGQVVTKYFPGNLAQIKYSLPFEVTKVPNKFHFEAKILGGGKNGQVEALALAISRSLDKSDHDAFHSPLRSAGLLTVDSRVRQRRHVGTGGKARRAKQSPKR